MARCHSCLSEVDAGAARCPSCGGAQATMTSLATEYPGFVAGAEETYGLRPGDTLAGRYRIVGLVGRGGMGEVYRADDLRLGEPVALKFLPRRLALQPGMRARFEAEVRNARNVAHPCVCKVYDIGESEGRTFLTMEYVDGEDLASLLGRVGGIPLSSAVPLARQIAEGLAAAHARGLLHRDLKPQNIMLDGQGRVRVTDFGVAVEADNAERGDLAGTPAYMAPERFLGRPATVQSDVYALGLVLYELVTRRKAITAETLAGWSTAHASVVPDAPGVLAPGLDPALERVILRCLEKDPAKRPPSVKAVLSMLPGDDLLAAALDAGETPSPELVAAASEIGSIAPRRAALVVGAIVLALALGMLAFWRYEWISLVPSPKSPAELSARAKELVGLTGWPAESADESWLYGQNGALTQVYLAGQLPARTLDALGRMTQFANFVYRQSPRTLRPYHTGDPVQPDDPPVTWTGEAQVVTSASGVLLAFSYVPPERDDTPRPAAPVDWRPLFAASGFAPDALQETAPGWFPMVPYDEHRAWNAVQDGVPVRIEGAAYKGRPVSYIVAAPWDASARDGGVIDYLWLQSTVSVVLLVFSLAGLSLLARRNLRQGRADRRGALKVAVIASIVSAVYSLCSLRWTGGTEAFMNLTRGFGPVALNGLLGWVSYLAVEPYLRRHAPRRLIAWARLLEGRWNDPLVGREALLGVLAGASMYAVYALPWLIGGAAGASWLSPIPGRMIPASAWWAGLDATLLTGMMNALGCYGVWLLFRAIVRLDSIAWLLCWIGFAAIFPYPAFLAAVSVVVPLVLGAIATIAARRGLVCGALAVMCYYTLIYTYLVAREPWLMWTGAVVLGALAVLVIGSLRVAVARR